MQDGVVNNVASQERIDNVKNSSAFPGPAIHWLLARHRLDVGDIDHLVVCSLDVFPTQMAALGTGTGSPGTAAVPSLLGNLRSGYVALDYHLPDNPLTQVANRVMDRRGRTLMDAGKDELFTQLSAF